MINISENEGVKLLVKALVAVKTEEECLALLDDLMTKKEVMDISQRLLVAKMLSEQTVYNKIVEETGASTATISRVKRSYDYGMGGYEIILSRITEEENK